MAERPGSHGPGAYFDTPERAERLHLVAHVIRNTEATPYIRAPEGAGKTRFAERLAAAFQEEASLVRLAGKAVTNIPGSVCEALGISSDRWPVAAVDAASDGGLLVLVDDADRLDAQALEALQDLKAAGGKLIFLGSSDPASLPVQWDLQLIDLPPFSEVQVRDFVDFLGDPAAVLLKDAQLSRLHRDCRGLPGVVISVLAAGHGLADAPVVVKRPRYGRVIGLAALVVLAGLMLWQQERINSWFTPQRVTQPAPPQPAVTAEPDRVPPPAVLAEPPVVVVPEASVTAEPAGKPVREPEAPSAPLAEPEPAVVAAPAPAAEQPPSVPEAVQPAAEEAQREPAPQPEALAGPAVSEEPAPPGPVVSEPVEAAEPAEMSPEIAAEAEAPGQRDLKWLRDRDPKALTLQLVGARDRHSIDGFVAKYQLTGNYVVYERDLGGKPWYSLIYGEYPDLAAAKRGRAALPKDLSSAWPRTFESVIRQLPPAD